MDGILSSSELQKRHLKVDGLDEEISEDETETETDDGSHHVLKQHMGAAVSITLPSCCVTDSTTYFFNIIIKK